MYASYFGLSEIPFSISPNPRYLYMSKRHREAMAHLLYGIRQAGGFVVLTGEVGTGKTTLCRCLLSQLPDNVDVAMLLNPNLDENELLAAICDELKIECDPECSPKQLLANLNEYLLKRFAEGRHTVIIIDEAQLLSREVLEQIRLLTNLETTTQKLLQIILIAQPELSRTLQRSDLRQLTQRVTARYHLKPLSSAETSEYIRYRLQVAGCQRSLFSSRAVHHVYKRSGGIPRLVNVICDRALMGAYAKDMSVVTASIARSAAREVLGDGEGASAARRWLWIPVAASLAAVLLYSPLADRLRNWVVALPLVNAVTTVVVDSAVPRAETPPEIEPPQEETGFEDSLARLAPRDVVAFVPGEVPEPDHGGASESRGANTLGLLRAFDASSTTSTEFPTFSATLREYGVLGGKLEAFQRLTELWGQPTKLSDADRVCSEIERLHLLCFRGQGTWNNVRNHNRAAILVLQSSQGHPFYAVVTAISEARVTLDFARERVEFPLTEVDPYWFGEYWLLWKPLPSGSQQLSFRDEGPDVLWLRKALKRVASPSPEILALDEMKPVFDTELLHHVIAYQKRNGLTAHGIVGVETLLSLNSALHGNALPLLITSAPG